MLKTGLDYPYVAKAMGGGLRNTLKAVDGIVAKRMMVGWGGKVAVIGRNMDDRVKKFAAGIKAETFSPTQEALDMFKKGDGSLLMKENKAWVQKLKDEGYTVYDVGLDPKYSNPHITGRNDQSKGEFYQMETKEIFNDKN